MKRRKISLLLTAAIVLTSYGGMFTKEAHAEKSAGIFDKIFSDMDNINANEYADDLPYYDGEMLSNVREPLIFSSNGGKIYGEGSGAESGDAMAWKDISAKPHLDSRISVSGKSYNLSGSIEILKSYEGDFTATGKKNLLASVVGASTTDGKALLLLCVSDAVFSSAMSPVVVLYEGTDNKNLFLDRSEWSNCISIVCGDVNGDGYDEIVTATPTWDISNQTAGSGNHGFSKNSSPYVWLMNDSGKSGSWNKSDGWNQEPFIYGGAMTLYNTNYLGAPGASSSLAVADIDGDGYDDIISAVSSTDVHYNSNYVSNGFAVCVARGDENIINMRAVGNRFHLLNYLDGDTYKKLGLTGPTRGDAACFDVTAHDVDGSGKPTIFVSIKHAVQSWASYSGDKMYTPDFYVAAFDYNKEKKKFVSSVVYNGGIYHHGWVDSVSGSDTNYVYKTKLSDCAPIRIGFLNSDFGLSGGKKGYSGSGTLLIDQKYIAFVRYPDGDTYRYDTEDKGSYTGEWGKGEEKTIAGYDADKCILYNNGIDVLDIRSSAVTRESDAAAVTVSTALGDKVYFLTPSGSGYPVNSQNAITYNGTAAAAMPDTDDDSVYLKFVRHKFFWADPVIVAALASPPYFDSLPDDNYVNGQTTYGKTNTSSTGETASFTVSAGAYVSTEIKAGGGGTAGVFESEVETMKRDGFSTDRETEISFTQSFSASGGEDTVVLSTVGYDAYEYTAYYPGADGKLMKSPYVVYVPHGGASACKMASLTYEDYLDIIPDTNEAMPDLKDVFSHTVGKPETYPDKSPNSVNVVTGSIMTHTVLGGFPTGSSSQSQSMEITESAEFAKTNGGSVSIKLGGGVESEADNIFGMVSAGAKVTGGFSGEKEYESGRITANSVGTSFEGSVFGQNESKNAGKLGKGEFSWRLLQYVYNSNPSNAADKPNQKFPVVTYIVSGIKQPEGVKPETVAVTPSERTVEAVGAATKNFVNEAAFEVVADGVQREAYTALEGAPLGMTLNTGSNIGTSRAFPFGVKINGNVEPGEYELRLNVGGVLSNPFKLTVTGYVPPQWLEADNEVIDFGSSKFVTVNHKPIVDAKTITVKNINTETLSGLEASLDSDDAFEITESLSQTDLAAGGTATLSVRPKTGLKAGKYFGVLKVSNGLTSVSINLEYKVNDPTLPGAPYIAQFAYSSNPVRVTVSAPEDDGGGEMIDYLYTIKDHEAYLDENGNQIWKSSNKKEQYGSFDIIIPEELPEDHTYEIGVKAVNEAGEGEAAWASLYVGFPANPPSEVRNVRVYTGDKTVAVTFDEPKYWGENEYVPKIDVKIYSVYVSKRGESGGISVGADNMQAIFNNLENGVQYDFEILAYNYYKQSSYAFTATPEAKVMQPSRPFNFKADMSYRTAKLSWEAPMYNGGSSITGYEVSTDGGESWINVGDSMSYTAENLTTNKEYTFMVRALTGGYVGDSAEIVSKAPSALRRFEWDDVTDYTGYEQLEFAVSTIEGALGYEISIDGGEWYEADYVEFGGKRRYCFSGLENGREYTIGIRAFDSEGPGPEKFWKRAPSEKAPMPVKNARVEAGNGKIIIYGESADSYGAQYSDGGRWWYFSEKTVSSGYDNGKELVVAIGHEPVFVDGIGVNTATNQYFKVTPDASIPDKPSMPDVSAVTGNGYTRFTWTLKSNGGSAILYYKILLSSSYDGDKEEFILPADQTEYTVYGDVAYFDVSAVNNVGESYSGSGRVNSRYRLDGVDTVSLPIGYSDIYSEAFKLIARNPEYDDNDNYIGMVDHDITKEAENWKAEGLTDKITFDEEQHKLKISSGLEAGEYSVVVGCQIHGYAYERIVTVRVGSSAEISSVENKSDGVYVTLTAPNGALLAVAAYNAGGKMTAVSFNDIADSGTYKAELNLSGVKTVKAMIVAGRNNISPLCEYKAIAVN